MKRRVTGNKAKVSDATKFSPIPKPMIRGEPERAAYKVVGSFLSIRATPNEPLTSFKEILKASNNEPVVCKWLWIKPNKTSVSV